MIPNHRKPLIGALVMLAMLTVVIVAYVEFAL